MDMDIDSLCWYYRKHQLWVRDAWEWLVEYWEQFTRREIEIDGQSSWWHYKMHQLWVRKAWREIIGIDSDIQVYDFDDKYMIHNDWLKECWDWNPNPIKPKGIYNLGNCYDCRHRISDSKICYIQPLDMQDRFYWDWEAGKPVTDVELKNLTCNLFSQRELQRVVDW